MYADTISYLTSMEYIIKYKPLDIIEKSTVLVKKNFFQHIKNFLFVGLDGNQGETSQSLKPTISCDSPIGDIPKWPGIDILMESYQKYQEGRQFIDNY